MPTVPTPSSQGSTVSFAGTAIGRVRGWRMQPGTATFEEYTHVGSTVIGTGQDARVVRQYVCTAIDPGTFDVNLYGCPPYTKEMEGSRGTLVVTFSGGLMSFEAYLESFDVAANVGEFLAGTARFKISGAGWTP